MKTGTLAVDIVARISGRIVRTSYVGAVLACVGALLLGTDARRLEAQDDAIPDRRDAFVAGTGAFLFHSDVRLNLHDFLVWRLVSEDPLEPRPTCLDQLPETDRRAFREAEAFYGRRLGLEVADRRDVLLDLRFHLAGHPDVDIARDEVVADAVARLETARPAYEGCWWADHDARNRRWIAAMLPRVQTHEDAILRRLAHLYQEEWALPIPVDVVGYASRTGATTVVNPDHVLLSGVEGIHDGAAGMEIVFHEASHTLVHPRFGTVGEVLAEASRDAGLERPPPDLWHVLLFYTTGRVVEARLEASGSGPYEPYLYAEGLFDRAWPEYRRAVETHWQPYIDGDVGMREAMAALVESVRLP